MPLLTMTSAVCLMRPSLTEQPNVFQSFHPIWGVRARPLSSALAGGALPASTTTVAATATTAATTTGGTMRIPNSSDQGSRLRKAARAPRLPGATR